MTEKLTILISAEHKKFIKSHARKQNKSISKFIPLAQIRKIIMAQPDYP